MILIDLIDFSPIFKPEAGRLLARPLGNGLWACGWAPLAAGLSGGCASSRINHDLEFHVILEGRISDGLISRFSGSIMANTAGAAAYLIRAGLRKWVTSMC